MAKLNDLMKLIEADTTTGAIPGAIPVTTTFGGSSKPTSNEVEVKLNPTQVAQIDALIDQSPPRDIHNVRRGNNTYYKSGKNWYTDLRQSAIMDPKVLSSLEQFQQQNKLGATQPATQQATTQQPATNIPAQALIKVQEVAKLYTNNGQPVPKLLLDFFRELQGQSKTQPVKESREFQEIIKLAGLK